MEGIVPRPEKIYLDDVIIIDGCKIHHTVEGLRYQIYYYNELLKQSVSEKVRSQDVTAHMKSLVEDWKLHLILYEKHTKS